MDRTDLLEIGARIKSRLWYGTQVRVVDIQASSDALSLTFVNFWGNRLYVDMTSVEDLGVSLRGITPQNDDDGSGIATYVLLPSAEETEPKTHSEELEGIKRTLAEARNLLDEAVRRLNELED